MKKMTAMSTITGPHRNRGRRSFLEDTIARPIRWCPLKMTSDPFTAGAGTGASRRGYRRRRTRRTSGRRGSAGRAARRASASRRRSTRTVRTAPSAQRAWSLPPLCDVECVEHDQHVQQPRDDEEGVAVLESDGRHLAVAHAERLGDEVRDADADVGEGGERHERLRQLEREE